jgi:hypothetical protein
LATLAIKQMIERPADLILTNGKIITVDGQFRIAQGVAIDATASSQWAPTPKSGNIQAKPQSSISGPRPFGLIDGHAHVDREGLKLVFPSLGTVRSIADIQDRVAELVRAAKPGEWIVTMPIGDPPTYFNVPDILKERRFPTRHDLDEVAPDNPVYIRDLGFLAPLPLVSITTRGRSKSPASPAPRGRRHPGSISKGRQRRADRRVVEDTLMPWWSSR